MDGNRDPVLIVEDLRKSFGAEAILGGVQFSAGRNNCTILLGPNGCGKTTLVRLLAQVIDPDRGSIKFVSNADGIQPRRSFVFQKPLLLPWLTVEENILLPAKFLPPGSISLHDYLENLLGKANLLGQRRRHPSELSGGQRQKVALLRALITKPDLIVMDEPFSSLDDETREHLQNYLVQLQADERLTILFVTHDLFEASLLGDMIVVLSRKPSVVVKEVPIAIEKRERRKANLDRFVAQFRQSLRAKAAYA